jgi:hypothetical protein
VSSLNEGVRWCIATVAYMQSGVLRFKGLDVGDPQPYAKTLSFGRVLMNFYIPGPTQEHSKYREE